MTSSNIILATVGAMIAFLTFRLTLSKERAAMRQTEVQLRSAVIRDMAEAAAELVAASRLVVARATEGTDVPDFRLARKDWLVRSAGVSVRIGAYLSGTSSGQAIFDDWTRLVEQLSRYNLLASRGEPHRADYGPSIAQQVNGTYGADYLPADWVAVMNDPTSVKYDQVYFRVGNLLLDQVLPLADRILRAPSSAPFTLRLAPRISRRQSMDVTLVGPKRGTGQ